MARAATKLCAVPDQIPVELNVLAEPLASCSIAPLTGFTRNGCCSRHSDDVGKHLVCVQVTEEFLAYSRQAGNDLSTPIPEFSFPGLHEGDQWCLCAQRWQDAFEQGCAPPVILAATHINALEICEFEDLKRYAVELS